MTREVYAEEIEEFLERLEGIGSARVVANEEGQIDHVYLTTESERDDGGLRRQIGAALMSQYGLHLEGWRLHVAHLRPAPGRLPPGHFRLFRIEETLTTTTARVLVDLRYEREGSPKRAVGVAQSSSGTAFRLRTVAQATLEAMGKVLADAGWKAALESVVIIPFAGVSVAMVGITLAPPGRAAPEGVQVQVGGEVVRQSETEAVVNATLRALGQATEEEAPRARDRWGRMEAFRTQYHRLILVPEATLAGPAPPVPAPPTAGGGSGEGEDNGEPDPVPPAPNAVTLNEPGPAPDPDVHDTIAGVHEIRPEIEGGATMSTREEPFRAESGRPGGRGGLEDDFYRRLMQSGVVVHIRCRDGYEIPEAVVKDFGTYSLLVAARNVEELVFKHAIISIRPRYPLPHEVPVQA